VERGGLVWAYLGPRSTPPPLPELEANMVPEGGIQIYQRECNWVQALEGDIDTGHTVFLHLGGMQADDAPAGTWARYALSRRAPRYEVLDTDSGVMYGACRPAEADTSYWRIANFLFPFWAMVPTGVLGLEVRARAWIPMDDEHTLALTIGRLPRGTAQVGRQTVGPVQTLPNTTDWYGRFRAVAGASNDYLIDRELQKTASYTGIGSIFLQDQAATESMGAIYDRSQERLGSSDAMVIRTRKRLLDAARALRDRGQVPPRRRPARGLRHPLRRRRAAEHRELDRGHGGAAPRLGQAPRAHARGAGRRAGRVSPGQPTRGVSGVATPCRVVWRARLTGQNSLGR
jgi:phenylpropionate dioxygenase-like ring-hydroxylating dioxygenase large terminal subunit